MSDTNRVRHSFKVESTYATAPSGELQTLPLTGETLKQDTSTVSSADIRSDRQIVDVIRTSASVSGDLNFEFRSTDFDEFMQYSLLSAGWSSDQEVHASTLSAAAVDNSFNDSGNGFGSFAVGQWVFVEAFSNAANNGWFRIVSKTNGKIVVEGGTLVNESAGTSRRISMGAQITNGTTLKSFSLERKYEDLTNVYAAFHGLCINSFNLSISAEQLITGAFGVMGKKEVSRTSSFGSSYAATSEEDIMNSIDNVKKVWIGSPSTANLVEVNSLSFNLQNNLRHRQVVGQLGPVSVGTGACAVSGTVQLYFANATQMDEYLNFTKTSLAFVVQQADGDNYVFDFPAIKFTSGQRVAGAQNQDCIADMAFVAYRDETQNCTVRIARNFSDI